MKSAEYALLILGDVLEWYRKLDEPGNVPNNQELHPLLREAKTLIDSDKEHKAKKHNADLAQALQ